MIDKIKDVFVTMDKKGDCVTKASVKTCPVCRNCINGTQISQLGSFNLIVDNAIQDLK